MNLCQRLRHWKGYLRVGIILLGMLLACKPSVKVIEEFQHRVAKIQQRWVPDPTLDVFTAKLMQRHGQWILRGETTRPEAHAATVALVDSLVGTTFVDSLVVLPDPILGDSVYGIVTVSVAHLREEPRHAAQLVDQAILGDELRLLKQKGGWYLVQTHYHYLGWMRRESLVRTDARGLTRWRNHPRVRVTHLFAIIHSLPQKQSEPVSDAVLNARLRQIARKGNWIQVVLPDGRQGYIAAHTVAADVQINLPRERLRKAIVQTARRMMGIPYLWGGNSSKGNDCSGFTQTVFFANGIQLPRDARQQALVGDTIQPDPTFSNVLPGDLLFFGSKNHITHVGISLGGKTFIHQSGYVHINSLDTASAQYSAYRHRTLQVIKRVF